MFSMGVPARAVAAVLAFAAAAAALDVPEITQTQDAGTCGASRVAAVTCTMRTSPDYPLPYLAALQYELERDGAAPVADRSCRAGAAPAGASDRDVELRVSRGDSIFGLRVCYGPGDAATPSRVVGVMFNTVARQLTCGDAWQPPGMCRMAEALSGMPLSHMSGICAANKTVCFNPHYVPRSIVVACPAGTGVVGDGDFSCTSCPNGTFNPGGLMHCAHCSAGHGPSLAGGGSCGCRPGQGFMPAAAAGGANETVWQCTVCPPGTYSPGGDLSPCIACPYAFMVSPRGASTLEDCVCQPGYGWDNSTTACTVCPGGQYSDGTRDPAYVQAGLPTLQPCRNCSLVTVPEGYRLKTVFRPQGRSARSCVQRRRT